ncbi:cystatin-like fold lipoprotein [Bacillus changyiensis]|uniref:cystatin-like fold lipoprotein n=1 Tax=Bacillus changyiensis TaxID=3004103 RepID=UPI0022E701CA|nr:cystatin-like fold lipoprotein [Bacillus changyiensis]MDA1478028.1 cystatin-like fold lipoprotein [Bacillus changyiensis]
MKRIFIFLSIIMIFVLAGCGGNKYDDAIDSTINQYKEHLKKEGLTYSDVKRNNAIVRVFDEGKYIQFAFYLKDHSRKLSPYIYYEKLGDTYERMKRMPGNGERDRLGLDRKKPDYEEVKGKETELKN